MVITYACDCRSIFIYYLDVIDNSHGASQHLLSMVGKVKIEYMS